MKVAMLNIEELKKDCSQENHEFGLSLEVLSVLADKQIELIDEEQYYDILEKMCDIEEDGDIFGIDWAKYDYVSITETDENGEPMSFYSFRKNWLNPIEITDNSSENTVKIFDEIGSAIKVIGDTILYTPVYRDGSFDSNDFLEIEELDELDNPEEFIANVNVHFNTHFFICTNESRDALYYSSKKCIVSRKMAEALQDQFPSSFKEGVFNNQYKIFGEISSIKSNKELHDYMETRIGKSFLTHQEAMEICKEVEKVSKLVAYNALYSQPTLIEWIAA